MRPSLRKQNPKEAKGRGRSAAQSPGTLWEKLGQRGEVFWGPESPPPNYRLGGLFEDSLRGNKNPEMEERGWRLVDGEGDIPPTRAHCADSFFFNVYAWMGYSSLSTLTLFQFHRHYFFPLGLGDCSLAGERRLTSLELFITSAL